MFHQTFEKFSHLFRLPAAIDTNVELRTLQKPNRPESLQDPVVDNFPCHHRSVHQSHVLLESLHQQCRALVQYDGRLFSASIHHLRVPLKVVENELCTLS